MNFVWAKRTAVMAMKACVKGLTSLERFRLNMCTGHTDRQTDRGTEIPFQYRARRVTVLAHGKYLIAQTLVQRDYIHHTISIHKFYC